jgi:hypothetical protein
MVTPAQKANTVESLPYNGSEAAVNLRGNSSELIVVNHAQSVTVSWSPVDRRALSIEMRARVVAGSDWKSGTNPDGSGANLGVPSVRFTTKTSHGRTVWDDPPLALPLKPDTSDPGHLPDLTDYTIQPYHMPARGLRMQRDAREFSITFTNVGQGDRFQNSTGLAFRSRVTIAVSFLPASAVFEVFPQTSLLNGSYYLTNDFGRVCVFPTGANEWRLFQPLTGAPFRSTDPYDAQVQLVSLCGTSTGGAPKMSDLAEFRPIPHDAFGFKTNVFMSDVAPLVDILKSYLGVQFR